MRGMAATSFRFEAIGTAWNITIPAELEPAKHEALYQDITKRIREYDKAYSRFRDDSLISEMALHAGEYELPADAPPIFALYKKAYDLTGGKVTPLIGSVMEEAGYDKSYSLIPKTLHTPPSWEETMVIEGRKLTLKQPALIDIGAAGKGYLIDLVAGVILGHGQRSFTIDAGGDIIHRSETREVVRIGLENPSDVSEVIGAVTLGNESICGSAGNRRAWGKYNHIINPLTLESPGEILATWVIAETALLGDMLATCLFFVPPETLLPHFIFTYIVLNKDFSLRHSPGMNAEFY